MGRKGRRADRGGALGSCHDQGLAYGSDGGLLTRTAIILRNIASNWAGFGVNAAVTLLLTPFVLHSLGPTRYGVWILSSSVIGYYGLLDMGFRAGVTQYVTRYLALRDFQRASECVSVAVAVLSVIACLMFALSVGAALAGPHVFALSDAELSRDAFWCILMVGCTTGVQFMFTPFMCLFMAIQRFDIANAIGIVTRLLSAVCIVCAIKLGYGLIGVSIATCSINLLDYLLRWLVAMWLVPQVKVSLANVNMVRLREIRSFGIWSFLISINAYIYQYVPNLLIGWTMPLAAVSHYSLAAGMARQINSMLTPVGQAVYPAATQMHTLGDESGLERLYHNGSRLLLVVTVTIVLMASFWANDFYRLWVGPQYLTNPRYQSVALLFQVILISVVTNYVSNIGSQIVSGSGRVKLIAVALIVGSIINLTLSVLLIRRFGLMGIALATVLTSVCIDLIAVPVLVSRSLGLSVRSFISHSCVRPVIVAAIEMGMLRGVKGFGGAATWAGFVAQVGVAALLCVVTVFAVGMTDGERARFVLSPIRLGFRRTVPARQAA